MTAEAPPRLRIDLACRRLGRSTVIDGCVRLLRDGADDAELILVLGGAPAARLLAEGLPAGETYWLRVWAARGLLWAGPGDDASVLRSGLTDDHWRVREMTCKVIARHRLGDLLKDMSRLESDPVLRVRAAAARAAVRIIEAET